MTFFIAISDLNSSNELDLYSAETADQAFEQAARDVGQHPAIAEGVVSSRSGFGGAFVRESRENDKFWHQVMADLFESRDNEEWFFGTDRADVVARAAAFHRGEEA